MTRLRTRALQRAPTPNSLLYHLHKRDESVRRAEEMFHQLDEDGNGDVTEVTTLLCGVS